MTRPARTTRAVISRAIAAAQERGLRVLAIRPDGTVVVDNGDNRHPLVPTHDNADDAEWSIQP